MAKKTGARIPEQNQIRRLHSEGLTAKEISDQLRIEVSVVRSFIEYFEPEEEGEEEETEE